MTSLPDRHWGRAPWIVIGVVAVLAIVATVLAVGLLSNLPSEASPSATESSRASESAAPSAPPQPSASASDPAGARLMQVTVDRLRMRTAASTGADIVRTFDLGEVVRVVSGPIEADGYAWYEVEDLDSRSGWAAMGGGAKQWLEAVPPDPATSELLLRFRRDGGVNPRSFSDIPVWPPDLTLTADGRVLLGWTGTLVRQLSPSGLAQMQRDVLDLPLLQQSADYDVEHLPDAPDVGPPHEVGFNTFTLGEGTARTVVTAVAWLGEEDGVYWVPSPERQILEDVAVHLLDVEAWLGPAAWSEPVAHRYVGSSYLFWLEPPSDTPASDDAPSVTGAAWPFEGPIEQFGDPVGQARCGYLDLGQAFEMLRLMRELGVRTYAFGDDRQLSLDGVGAGSFVSGAGWTSFFLTPRSPDGYPSCAD
jgi:hypothetical protein